MATYPSIDTELLRSFVAIADHGGFTRAAEAVNRTQSAISMQMKRLEQDVLQRDLFERDGRGVRLTAEGQVLLGYARRILKLHGEVINTLREPHMVGSVRIGTPDDYVMRFLPGILSRFAQSFPLVQVEVHCEPSPLLLQRKDLDLTIVTREPGTEIGQLLRQERFVWAEAPGFELHEQRPLPLAMFNSDCFCRAWACNALDAREIDYRMAYTSPSLAAIVAVVSAGLAVTAQLQSVIPPQLRILDEAQGLPALPGCSIVLLRNGRQSQISETLAEHIVEGFRL
ncbi:LysR family transcriptional regulator [Stutzerimonas nosocomialis]|uniref:LysR family transcriptional regulator n=1 Tax=Stutzerimonas nosocomialis TaxID=1056496 RepID=UPI00110888DA|nr:LysR family transcriptional regulator [Stutzerimonas nosocomialis]TLX59506.1 LysR family transcriptional regulator [Stutzerimonas nosocomialis]